MQYQTHSEAQRSRFKHKDASGRVYKLDDLTASRLNSDSGKFEWRGTMPPPSRGWAYKLEQLEEWWNEGRIVTKRDGTPRKDGGLNHISNRILLCGPCNRLKSHTLTLSGLRRENQKRGYMRGGQ